jgi:predicted Holliday junction resolvase-like endonuclease
LKRAYGQANEFQKERDNALTRVEELEEFLKKIQAENSLLHENWKRALENNNSEEKRRREESLILLHDFDKKLREARWKAEKETEEIMTRKLDLAKLSTHRLTEVRINLFTLHDAYLA